MKKRKNAAGHPFVKTSNQLTTLLKKFPGIRCDLFSDDCNVGILEEECAPQGTDPEECKQRGCCYVESSQNCYYKDGEDHNRRVV